METVNVLYINKEGLMTCFKFEVEDILKMKEYLLNEVVYSLVNLKKDLNKTTIKKYGIKSKQLVGNFCNYKEYKNKLTKKEYKNSYHIIFKPSDYYYNWYLLNEGKGNTVLKLSKKKLNAITDKEFNKESNGYETFNEVESMLKELNNDLISMLGFGYIMRVNYNNKINKFLDKLEYIYRSGSEGIKKIEHPDELYYFVEYDNRSIGISYYDNELYISKLLGCDNVMYELSQEGLNVVVERKLREEV